MPAFTICDNAIGYALRMAARGLRPWLVYLRAAGWCTDGCDYGGAPDVTGPDTRALDVIDAFSLDPQYVCYPTGLVLPIDEVNWVWWIAEERTYRQGSAIQAQKYATRKGYESPVCVDPQYLHGSQVREDRSRGYVFAPSLSFPSWTQERY